MKNFTPLLILFFFCLQSRAQINYISTVPGSLLQYHHFKNAGEKLVFNHNPDSIVILNYDGSVFKTIHIPDPGFSYGQRYSEFISESLFDTDSSNFEYMVRIYDSNGMVGYIRIYDENGNVLFAKDSVMASAASSYETYSAIFSADSITYMKLENYYPGAGAGIKSYLYTLPGKLENSCCCNQDNIIATGGGDDFSGGGENFLLSSSPNPSRSYTKVYYDLPKGETGGTLIFYGLLGKEVKRFQVSALLHYITVSTDNLPSGTYVYRLITSSGVSEGKEHVVVR
jgi:hypothetical protein